MKPREVTAWLKSTVEDPVRIFDGAGSVPVDTRAHALWVHLSDKTEGVEVDALPLVWRHLLATMAFDREAYSGGIGSFFNNSSSRYADDVVTGLDAVGAARHAELARAVMAHSSVRDWISNGRPRPARLDDAVDDMTRDYTALDPTGAPGQSLPDLWLTYAAANRATVLDARDA